MISFMGGSGANPDVATLQMMQVGGSSISAMLILVSVGLFSRGGGLIEGLRTLWSHVPGWLIFVLILLNSLGFIGELAFVLIAGAFDGTGSRVDHLSLVCLLASSLAFAALFALGHWLDGREPYSRERW